VFLLCWVPFFSINIISAVCIRYDLYASFSLCNIHPLAFSLFVWLGYINSFLNQTQPELGADRPNSIQPIYIVVFLLHRQLYYISLQFSRESNAKFSQFTI